MENPYAHQDGTWNGQEWQKEKKERSQELKDLQSQNGAGNERIAKSDFPTTFADLSFTERNEIKSTGYEPYKDSSAYKTIGVESEETYRNRLSQLVINPRPLPNTPGGSNENNPTSSNTVVVPGNDTYEGLLVFLR